MKWLFLVIIFFFVLASAIQNSGVKATETLSNSWARGTMISVPCED